MTDSSYTKNELILIRFSQYVGFFLKFYSPWVWELLCLFAHDITILGKSQVGSPRPITIHRPQACGYEKHSNGIVNEKY
jgi:hypothetical protein